MLMLLLSLGVVILVWLLLIYPFMMVKSPVTATIKIPKDATEQTVSDSLSKYFGTGYAKKVMMAMKLRRTDLKKRHGAYRIEKGTNAFTTMRAITSGGQTPVKLTITGYRSLPLLAEHISNRLDFPADSLMSLFKDQAVMSKYGLTPENAMALVLDDTYEVYWTASPRQVLEKLADNYTYFWNEDRREQAAGLGLTPPQMMTLASIVDEESNEDSEKGTIGQLYINRLNAGMPLQADPTIRFAIGDFTIRRVLRKHLAVESPYNTYLHKGLPPGPIRTGNKATVREILNAEPNRYLYMCADENFSGHHNFAEDYNEHVRNAMRYQHALNQRGIK